MATIQINGENIKFDKRVIKDGYKQYFKDGVRVAMLPLPGYVPEVKIVTAAGVGADSTAPVVQVKLSKSQQKRIKVQTA